jgi:hypothetical protein
MDCRESASLRAGESKGEIPVWARRSLPVLKGAEPNRLLYNGYRPMMLATHPSSSRMRMI